MHAYRLTRYELSGSGPALVLIHGVGLDLSMWEAALPRLERHFTVLRYDLIGHGGSQPVGDPVQLADFVEQLRALLEHLDISRPHVLGFSLGGIVARGWAAARPERIARLVVLCSIAPRDDEQKRAIGRRLAQLEQGGVAATLDAAIARWFTPAFIRDHPDAIERTKATLRANEGPGYAAAYRFFATADGELERLEGTVRCPLLAIAAQDDPGSTPEMARRIAAGAELGRAHTVPGLRHMAVVEAPDAVLDPVIDFLVN